MSSVTLNENLSNANDFVTSLFSNRNYGHIEENIITGDTDATFTNGTSKGRVLNSWLAAWQHSQGDPQTYNYYQSTDYQLINFLAEYIKTNNLVLAVPNLELKDVQSGTAIARYNSNGYQSSPFLTNGAWNYGQFDSSGRASKGSYPHDTVTVFLRMLYYGAHMVVISSPDDTNTSVQSFYDRFRNHSGLDESWDKFNSHYTNTGNTSGYYYLSINSDSVPSSNPLIPSFLVGKTSDFNNYNTFIQLEGWQNHFPYIGGWHAADYDAHENTLWNYSTFGACAYSEKRCTTVFLAPADFNLTQDSSTHMPLYVGAGSKQGWMNTDLLVLTS